MVIDSKEPVALAQGQFGADGVAAGEGEGQFSIGGAEELVEFGFEFFAVVEGDGNLEGVVVQELGLTADELGAIAQHLQPLLQVWVGGAAAPVKLLHQLPVGLAVELDIQVILQATCQQQQTQKHSKLQDFFKPAHHHRFP